MATGVARAELDWTVRATAPEPGMLRRRRSAPPGSTWTCVLSRRCSRGLARPGTTRRDGGSRPELLAAAPGIAGYRRRSAASLAAGVARHPPRPRLQDAGARSAVGAGASQARLAPARLCERASRQRTACCAASRRVLSSCSPTPTASRPTCEASAARVCRSSRSYNGVDLDRFAPAGPASTSTPCAGLPPAPAGTLRIGLIGTFGLWKGHRTFLDAVARLSRPSAGPRVPDWRRPVPDERQPGHRAVAAGGGGAARHRRPRGLTGPVADPASTPCGRSTSSCTPAPGRSRSAW